MPNQFLKLRRSAIQGKIPDTSSLDLGELAINTFDGQLFLKKSGSQGELVTVVGSTGSFTGSFTGNGAGLNNIPASGITGLNLSRIATGSVTASVNTDISSSFRLTSGSNTLLNVTREGFVWIGNGAFTNQAYQLDVQGTARVSGDMSFGTATQTGINYPFRGKVRFVSPSNPFFGGLTSYDFEVWTTAYFEESLIVKNGGGIGTSSATTRMYFQGNNAYFRLNNGTNDILNVNEAGVLVSLENQGTPTTSAILEARSTTKGFLPTRTNSTASITSPAQGLLTYITASGDVEGLWQYRTGSNGWVQFLHNSSSIPASSVVGLNLSRISTGSITASVSPDISASFRLTSGSNTLLNVTREGFVWIGNGTFTNQAYQLDVNGNTRVSGNLYIGNAGHYLLADTNNFRIYDKNSNILFQAFPSGVSDNELYIQSGVGKIYINATNAGATILDGAVGSSQPETFIIKRGYFANVSPTTKNVFKVQTQYYSNISNGTILRGIYVDIDDTSTYTGFADVRAFESLKGGGYFNTTNVAASAILQADSTTKGFLAPRMTAAQRTAISTPAQGLIVYDTGSATEGLWFYNSGSNPGWQEVLTNSGSQSISGSITASNALITGTLTVTQNILIGSSQFNNTSSVTVAGITTVSQLSTSSYTSCFYNYTVASASNARSGQVMTVWNGSSLRYIEVVTTDIGDTNLVAVSASLSSGFVRLQVSASSGWTFKNISNLL